jgi:hypothetical protein
MCKNRTCLGHTTQDAVNRPGLPIPELDEWEVVPSDAIPNEAEERTAEDIEDVEESEEDAESGSGDEGVEESKEDAEESEAESSEESSESSEESDEEEIDPDQINLDSDISGIETIRRVLYSHSYNGDLSSWHPALRKICEESYEKGKYMSEVDYAHSIRKKKLYSEVSTYIEDLRQEISQIDPYNHPTDIIDSRVIIKILTLLGPIYPDFRSISTSYPIIHKPLGGCEESIDEMLYRAYNYLYFCALDLRGKANPTDSGRELYYDPNGRMLYGQLDYKVGKTERDMGDRAEEHAKTLFTATKKNDATFHFEPNAYHLVTEDDSIAEDIMKKHYKRLGILKPGAFTVGPKNKSQGTFARSTEIVGLSVGLSENYFRDANGIVNRSISLLFAELDTKRPKTPTEVLAILNNHAIAIRPILQEYAIQYFTTGRDYNTMRIMHESAILGHRTIFRTADNLCIDLILKIRHIRETMLERDYERKRKVNAKLLKKNAALQEKMKGYAEDIERLTSIMEQKGLI